MARGILLLLLFIVPFIATAREEARPVLLTRDSLPRSISRGWRISVADHPAMAARDFVDSSWQPADTRVMANEKGSEHFTGLNWFRLRFSIDSTLAGQPMTLKLRHNGASEIYLDGKLLTRFGHIGSEAETRYEDPLQLPVVIVLPEAGEHVLAVRYANYNVQRNQKLYEHKTGGFTISVWDASNVFSSDREQLVISTFAFVLLFTLFLTLAIIHLLMYLYYRAEGSNLYFSVFSGCMAFCILSPFLMRSVSDPAVQLSLSFWIVPIGGVACAAFSGFINALFSKRKQRFYVIAAISLLPLLFRFFSFQFAFVALIVAIGAISLEGVVLIIVALYRKVKGARIIGAGMLLFVLLMLFIVISIATVQNFDLRDDTIEGQIVVLTMVVAIVSMPLSMSAYLAWSFATVNRRLKSQLEQVQELSEKSLAQELEKQRLLASRSEELEREVSIRTEELRGQKKKSDDLLLNILPEEVAEELKETGKSEARLYQEVSVLFTDFVNFTQVSETLSPGALVAEIDHCFKAFDAVIEKHGLEKIKTVGDAYIAVSGMPAANPNHARDVVRAALDIQEFMAARMIAHPTAFGIRLGVHSGAVVAGIVGVKKFAYDIWGDTVNTAARMEQHSETGRINISAQSYGLVKDDFECHFRGELEVKHKGKMGMYFVEGTISH